MEEVPKQIIESIEDIKYYLKILARDTVERVKSKVLSTKNKKEIYDLIDGKKDTIQLAKSSKATLRYVQLLINEFEIAGLIRTNKAGKKTIPVKLFG